MNLEAFIDELAEDGICITTKSARFFFTLDHWDGFYPAPVDEWTPPVGSERYPPPAWYVATFHDLTGKRNSGYAHTGIDLNVARPPYGDVDRGQPVFAVDGGIIYRTGYSPSYLGSVIIKVEYHGEAINVQYWYLDSGEVASDVAVLEPGMPLYIRYWHLDNNDTFKSLQADVARGQCLGHIGNYKLGAGGDHLHFDMCLDPFEPHWWFTKHPTLRWIDPVLMMKWHMGPAIVDLMVSKEHG